MSSCVEHKILFRRLIDCKDLTELWNIVDWVEDASLFFPGSSPEAILAGSDNVVLFGAGMFAESVILTWCNRGKRPAYCVDSDKNKWGEEVCGIPIFSPEKLFDDESKPLIVIAAMQTHSIEEVLNGHVLPYLYAERDGSVGRLAAHFLLRHKKNVNFVYSSLADNESRDVFLSVMKARIFQGFHFAMTGNYFSNNVATLPQYFQDDIIKLTDGEFFVDCGSFDGETIISFVSKMWTLGFENWKIMSFDSDKANTKNTLSSIAKYGIKNVNVLNVAIGDKEGIVDSSEFYNCRDGSESSHVQMLTLDNCLRDLKPTFIKMDIEGHELKALEGAKVLINKFQPKLSICSYHYTSHLIDIPLYILSHFPNYRIYIRHHSANTLWETVCYAVID